MKEFKFTLYEVFGYLFPGYAALFAIFYLYSTFFNPSQEVALSILDNSKIFIAFSVLAYVSGHMVQALANYFYWFLSPEKVINSETCDSKGSFNFELIKEAEIRIKKLLNIGDEKTISLSNLTSICDDYIVQNGNNNEREIYVYREGFYRGISISFLMLSVPLIVSFFQSKVVFLFDDQSVALTRLPILYCLFFVFLASFLSFKRYKRFYGYRIKHSISSFVSLNNVKGG